MAAIIKTDQLWLDQTTSSTVGAPALIFGADSLSGLYRIGTNNIGLTINGTKLLDLSSATFAVTGAGTFSTTLGVTGATTLSSTLAVTGAGTFSTTLGVSGTVSQGASPATISGSGVAANGASAKGTWVTHQQNTQSVSTVAKTIATSSFASATSTGVLYVYGYYSGFAFMDVIYFSTQSTLVTVVSSTTINGSPNPRTYTMSGPAVQLSITTNTYFVNVFGFESSNPT